MQWLLEHWPWIIVFFVVWAICFYILATCPVQFRKPNRKQVEAIDPADSEHPFPSEQVSAGTFEGIPYEVYFANRTDKTPAAQQVLYRTPAVSACSINKLQRPLSRLHRFLKRHGIQYYRFFDRELDAQAVVFVDDDSSGLSEALRTPSARDAIKRLLNLGATKIVMDLNCYDAISLDPPNESINQQTIDETLAALRDLANASVLRDNLG